MIRYKQKIHENRISDENVTVLQPFSHTSFYYQMLYLDLLFLPNSISAWEWHKFSIIPGQWMSEIRWQWNHSQINIGDCRNRVTNLLSLSLTALPHISNQKLNRGRIKCPSFSMHFYYVKLSFLSYMSWNQAGKIVWYRIQLFEKSM